jgi:sulfur relay (sulfurtransferase) DsrC/TusE family protein
MSIHQSIIGLSSSHIEIFKLLAPCFFKYKFAPLVVIVIEAANSSGVLT